MMIRGRLIHLLIVVALLCSQMVSAAHIAGHLHGPRDSESQFHEHADHIDHANHANHANHGLTADKAGHNDADTQHKLPLSCTMYHIHAGACFLPQDDGLASVAGFINFHQLPSLTPEWVMLVRGLHSIRGPPHFS
ncbi:hypothetical protein [Granulosicoccus antarcticus]|uniref:Cobalt-zinc-cadmium resistance protein CzcI n=1 Tax=Granulosicoccus antarcticus IMCC3135 TaxID=1192854 RepID=A0A2Z2P027_9GAMM|nr:hypothetical protein [Granulosicoccus antarcticus]ASJ76065.1 hypothetical protein IMCC3135_30080 [Granulosicoccus antarcticus IMCC3135]